jgi:hypothetical protein
VHFLNYRYWPWEGDITGTFVVPESTMHAIRLFLGFDDRQPFGSAAVDLLRGMADILGSGSMLPIGIDHALMLSVKPFLHQQRYKLWNDGRIAVNFFGCRAL